MFHSLMCWKWPIAQVSRIVTRWFAESGWFGLSALWRSQVGTPCLLGRLNARPRDRVVSLYVRRRWTSKGFYAATKYVYWSLNLRQAMFQNASHTTCCYGVQWKLYLTYNNVIFIYSDRIRSSALFTMVLTTGWITFLLRYNSLLFIHEFVKI